MSEIVPPSYLTLAEQVNRDDRLTLSFALVDAFSSGLLDDRVTIRFEHSRTGRMHELAVPVLGMVQDAR